MIVMQDTLYSKKMRVYKREKIIKTRKASKRRTGTECDRAGRVKYISETVLGN